MPLSSQINRCIIREKMTRHSPWLRCACLKKKVRCYFVVACCARSGANRVWSVIHTIIAKLARCLVHNTNRDTNVSVQQQHGDNETTTLQENGSGRFMGFERCVCKLSLCETSNLYHFSITGIPDISTAVPNIYHLH